MRTFIPLFLLPFSLCLAACSDSAGPVIGEPQPLTIETADQVTGPRLTAGPDGRLVLSWMETRDKATALRYAALSEGRFGKPATVVTDDRMFVNWADLPSVMHVADEHWIAHWLRYSADKTYSYDVVVSQSVDDGATWTDALPVHTDGTPTEHGFVSMHRHADGVSLLWLDPPLAQGYLKQDLHKGPDQVRLSAAGGSQPLHLRLQRKTRLFPAGKQFDGYTHLLRPQTLPVHKTAGCLNFLL